MKEKDLIRLKEEINAAQIRLSELRGKRNVLEQSLLEYDCETVDQAQEKLQQIQQQIKETMQNIEDSIDEIEQKYTQAKE